MPVEKAKQLALLERMAVKATVGACGGGRLETDRLALRQIALDHRGMDVRRLADRRRVAEIGRHETNRGVHVARRLAGRARRPELGEHGREAQGGAPGAEVLCGIWKSRRLAQVLVDVAGGEIPPVSLRLLVSKDATSGGCEHRAHEARETAVHHHLPLLLPRLPTIGEGDRLAFHADVRLAQRGDAERAVLARVALSARPEAPALDELRDRRGHARTIDRASAQVGREGAADAREIPAELAYAVVLAQLARFHRTLVVAVLLATACVDSPRLNGGGGAQRDVDFAPCRWNRERRDARERTRVAHHHAVVAAVAEGGAGAPLASKPARRHATARGGKK